MNSRQLLVIIESDIDIVDERKRVMILYYRKVLKQRNEKSFLFIERYG